MKFRPIKLELIYLFLHEIKTHSNERQAHEKIERASDELELGLSVRVVDRIARHIVA